MQIGPTKITDRFYLHNYINVGRKQGDRKMWNETTLFVQLNLRSKFLPS